MAVPADPNTVLSIISLISWAMASVLCFKYAGFLSQNRESAFLSSFLSMFSFPLILVASAPMADAPSVAASLAILYLCTKVLHHPSGGGCRTMAKAGIMSGLLLLIRENVAAAILAILLYLLSKRMFRESLTYVTTSASFPLACNVLSTLTIGENYLTWYLKGGALLSIAYTGVPYSPSKVVGYLLDGLTPIIIVLSAYRLFMEHDRERFKMLHLYAIPHLLIAVSWPSLFEPRLAIVVLPALSPLAGEGLRGLFERLSQMPVYGGLGLKRLRCIVLAKIFLLNLAMAYLNNGLEFSPIWRYIFV